MKYVITDVEELGKKGVVDPETGELYKMSKWDYYPRVCVALFDGDEFVRIVGWDSSPDAPEDANLGRDFSWVIDELNTALEMHASLLPVRSPLLPPLTPEQAREFLSTEPEDEALDD